jgi:hypothetical protein
LVAAIVLLVSDDYLNNLIPPLAQIKWLYSWLHLRQSEELNFTVEFLFFYLEKQLFVDRIAIYFVITCKERRPAVALKSWRTSIKKNGFKCW